ncbi:MAG: antibiotic biosynthesis monooxygenase [Cyanobacteria bacterium RM1_2_2]|nr:antibiotic biosynthesis monooxygenase [Cyanobacteria bacterium RM1_2_2]
MSIRVIARIFAAPGQETALQALLMELVEPSRSEPGCLHYELLQSSATPTEFVILEEWETDEAETQHLQSAHVQEAFWEGESLISTPPEIRRYHLLA